MDQPSFYAVITGDIIRSSALSSDELATVRGQLQASVRVAKRWKRGLIHGQLEFFRGDTWQVLLTEVPLALRVGMLLRAGLIAHGLADSRFAIGMGTVDSLSPRQVSLSTGEAFVLSGRGLDDLNLYSNLTIRCPATAGLLVDWLPAVGQLCDVVISGWTARQAQIVSLALDPTEPKQETIAERLQPPVARQVVTKALESAHWNALRHVLRTFERTDWQAVLRNASEPH